MLLRLELLLELRVRNKAVRGRSRAAIMLLNVRRESSARPALGRAAPVGQLRSAAIYSALMRYIDV